MNIYKALIVFLFLPQIIFSAKTPNVILILTDDQGYQDLNCHGNKHIKTPYLNKLHSESTRFNDFHTSPFCAPTRASIFTGRFPELTGVRATIRGRNHLNKDETTLAEYFKESGYRTGLFGKWHLGRNYPFRPEDRGFEEVVRHGDGGIGTVSDYWGNDKMNDTYLKGTKWEKFSGFSADVFFEEGMTFIKKNKDKPFFAYIATHAPHWPWNIKQEWSDEYDDPVLTKVDKKRKRKIKDFYASITRIDYNIGRLRKCLQENGIAENTILIFMSDNGTAGSWGFHYGGMKGIKGTPYEGGHRVPFFFHWPAKGYNKGQDISKMAGHIDILPTLVELCDLKKPKKAKYEINGHSFAKLLENPESEWPDRKLFVHCQNSEIYEKWRNAAVLTSQWRLVNNKELYNIKKDPAQNKNIATENPEIFKALQKEYDKYWGKIKEGKTPHQRAEIGSGKINYTFLAPDAWILDPDNKIIWNQPDIASAKISFGKWAVSFLKEDTYSIAVSRWPKEANTPINSIPLTIESDVNLSNKPFSLPESVKINAVKLKLKIGEKVYYKDVKSDDKLVSLDIKIPAGDIVIRAWFINNKNEELPAYFVYIYE